MIYYIRSIIVILLIFNYFFILNTCDKARDRVEEILMKIEKQQQKVDDTLWFGLPIFEQMIWLIENRKSVDINILEAILRRIKIMESIELRGCYSLAMHAKLGDIKVRAKGVLQSVQEEFRLEKEGSKSDHEEEYNEE